jgi:hypothetical protein
MHSAGFQPAISAIERPRTYVFDSVATGIGLLCILLFINKSFTMPVLVQEQYHHGKQIWTPGRMFVYSVLRSKCFNFEPIKDIGVPVPCCSLLNLYNRNTD